MKRSFLFSLLPLIAAVACGQTPSEFRPLPSALGDVRGLAMGFEGLRPLGQNQGLYAAWINLDNGDVVGLGFFNVNADGRPVGQSGDVIDRFTSSRNLFKSVSLLITIELFGGADGPGGNAILQGPFIDGVAQLSVPSPLLIEQVQGSYRVFTPTDGPDTNEASGVWAVSEDDEPLLELVPLNNVYVYEHFVIIDGQFVTMARFTVPDAPDFNNPYSGPLPAPEFPGEDFLTNAPGGLTFPADLSGARLLVTLEPIIGDSAEPSQLVLLEAVLPAGLEGGEIIPLVNRTADFPTGVATVF